MMRLYVSLWLLLLSLSAFAQGVTLPDSERIELDNGTILILTRKDDVPLVGVTAMLRGGAARDPDGQSGMASLFAGALSKGAGERDAAAFAETVDAAGGRLSASAGLEAITISGEFLARDATLMVELLGDMLLRPTLSEAEFDKLKSRAISLQRAAKDSDAGELLPSYANALLFDLHPYARPVNGSEASLAAIRYRNLGDYYENSVGGDRLIVSVAGDFDVDAMQTLLSDTFGEWRPAAEPLTAIEEPPMADGGRVLLVDRPGATQTYFWIGNRGVAVDFNGRAELDLVNTLFGGRFTSMLSTALRIDAGLTYGARSELQRPSESGTVAIVSFTATETSAEAIDLALDVLGRFQAVPFDDASLESARNYVLGLFPMAFETAAQLARQLATLEIYGLDRNHVDGYADALSSVTPASAASVTAEVYPAAGDLVYVLIGDAEKIREAVSKYGAVIEHPMSAPTFRVTSTADDSAAEE